MFETRNRRQDLFALVLLALTSLLGLSLLSYRREDPLGEPFLPLSLIYRPDTLSFPASGTVHNWCGRSGALVADMLLSGLGWCAYYLVGSLAVATGVLLVRGTIRSPVLRLTGWVLSLLALTSLTAMFAPSEWSGPMIGPGGYLGTLGYGVLRIHFAAIGGFLLALSALLCGLLLCTDYVLFQLAMTVVATLLYRMPYFRRWTGPSRAAATRQSGSGLTVRIGGRRQASRLEESAEDEDVLEDEEYDVDEEEEEFDPDADEPEEEEDEGEDEAEEDEEADAEEEADVVVVPAAKATQQNPRAAANRSAPTLRLRKPESSERQDVIAQLEHASRREESRDYDLPALDLLLEADEFCGDQQEKEVRRKAKILEKTFRDFGFQVKVVEIETGPVIAQYEIELEAGLRLSKITSLADDLAIALRVPSVRIVAPIPGKNTVGIEVPNEERQIVRLREVMQRTNGRIKKMRIPLFLGKDVSGNPLTVDLSTLPHLLIAGRTGTGKSVCLNAIICSILMTRRPDEVRMLMIDPKMVELSGYKTLPHLMHPVVTDMRKAEAILAWAVDKMEERYGLLARAGVRHIGVYNQLGEEELLERLRPADDEERAAIPRHLPYIVIVADEIADLMMTSGKEVEQHIIRLAQKSRAVGIHLILATQKPTVDVITGLIKSNLPARIAFQVASRIDSRVVLDEMGADKLLGNGDMLFLWPGTSCLLRGQGTYLSDDEIDKIVACVSTGEQDFVTELVQLKVDPAADGAASQNGRRDELYESAVEIVIREGRGSVSLLQRCLGIGYGRAARLIDFMAEDGVVGPYNGSQAREVVMSLTQFQQRMAGESQEETTERPAPHHSHRILPMPDPASRTRHAPGKDDSGSNHTRLDKDDNTRPADVEDEQEDEDEDLDDEEEFEDEEYADEEELDEDELEDDEEQEEVDDEAAEEDPEDGEEEEEEEEEEEDADAYEEDEYEAEAYEGDEYEPEAYVYEEQDDEEPFDESTPEDFDEEAEDFDEPEPFRPARPPHRPAQPPRRPARQPRRGGKS